MTDFAAGLVWDDGRQPDLPVPAGPLDRNIEAPASAAPTGVQGESRAERLQRIAGNAVLARDAEEAEAAGDRLGERRPQPASDPAAREARGERQPAKLAAVEMPRLSQVRKAAVAGRAALAQVLASFEHDPSKADLLRLALLLEQAPRGIVEQTARVLARAVMRADVAQRAAMAARISTQLGQRRELRLTRLLAKSLAGLVAAPDRSARPLPAAPTP